jgi:hypothetical protein
MDDTHHFFVTQGAPRKNSTARRLLMMGITLSDLKIGRPWLAVRSAVIAIHLASPALMP